MPTILSNTDSRMIYGRKNGNMCSMNFLRNNTLNDLGFNQSMSYITINYKSCDSECNFMQYKVITVCYNLNLSISCLLGNK